MVLPAQSTKRWAKPTLANAPPPFGAASRKSASHLDTLHYGDRVDVVSRRNDSIKVRTASGELGWVEGRYLMDPALWQRSTKLLKQVLPMPVQARGRTKVATNLRVEPGRTQARLYQFGRGVPVEIVGRAAAEWVQTSDEKESSNEPQDTKKEDWYLIRGLATRPPGDSTARAAETTTTAPGDQTLPIAGWVIARFIELDLPDPVRDGTSSANIRTIAWFELNRVSDPAATNHNISSRPPAVPKDSRAISRRFASIPGT